MAKEKKTQKDESRSVVRKKEQLVAVLRNSGDREDFERRLREKCDEAGLKVPPLIPYGAGERVAIACKSRDQAIFVLDFAEEAIAEMPT